MSKYNPEVGDEEAIIGAAVIMVLILLILFAAFITGVLLV